MLLHGFPEFWWAWRHQLVALGELGHRAAAVDLRGYGDTDKPPRGYDLWTLAGDAAGLIGALGESRAHVVGHGWGGLVAWTVAALHPRRVLSLAVLGAPHPLRGSPPGQSLEFQVPRLPERSLLAESGARVEQILRDWSGPGWPETDDFAAAAATYRHAIQVPGVVHCAMEHYRWAFRSRLRLEGRRFAAEVARPVTAPVLELRGAVDPLAAGAAQAVEGAGHFLHEEQPQATTALLHAHLSRGTPPRRPGCR